MGIIKRNEKLACDLPGVTPAERQGDPPPKGTWAGARINGTNSHTPYLVGVSPAFVVV